jgi:uncharacterized protein (TIGR02145 family)
MGCMNFRISALILFITAFTGLQAQTIKDIDGNAYNTVTIGKQVWLVENLKTTRFNDGTEIPLGSDDVILQQFAPSYCWFNNDEAANKNRYGALYNWYSVASGKLCPAGWHVPTDVEWKALHEYLITNGYGYEGSGNDVAKSIAARSGWKISSAAGTVGNDQNKSNNKTGFSALPGGVRYFNGKIDTIGKFGFWWSSTEYYTTNAWSNGLTFNSGSSYRFSFGKRNCLSVRCIRD